jgi:hypothetical protein
VTVQPNDRSPSAAGDKRCRAYPAAAAKWHVAERPVTAGLASELSDLSGSKLVCLYSLTSGAPDEPGEELCHEAC